VRLATRIELNTARVNQWLAVGDVETAGRWTEACGGGLELEQMALARLRLAQGRTPLTRNVCWTGSERWPRRVGATADRSRC
jgi:hypothetical protein